MLEQYNKLELTFSDGTLKLISLEGMPVSTKRQWRDWAKKLYESNTFIVGWELT
jgi:hypothetical protein